MVPKYMIMKKFLISAVAVFMMSGTVVATEKLIVVENNVMAVQSENVMDKMIALINGYTRKINAVRTIDELMAVTEQCNNEMTEFAAKYEDDMMALEVTLKEYQLANYEKKLEKALADFEAAVEKKVEQFAENDDAEVYEEIEEEAIVERVEEQPEFPGGIQALMKFLSHNIQYPQVSRDNGSQGKALVTFIVNTDGTIQDIELFKSTGDMYLDKEAIRLVGIMPKWKPGRIAGKPVRVKFTLPVNFRLQ